MAGVEGEHRIWNLTKCRICVFLCFSSSSLFSMLRRSTRHRRASRYRSWILWMQHGGKVKQQEDSDKCPPCYKSTKGAEHLFRSLLAENGWSTQDLKSPWDVQKVVGIRRSDKVFSIKPSRQEIFWLTKKCFKQLIKFNQFSFLPSVSRQGFWSSWSWLHSLHASKWILNLVLLDLYTSNHVPKC